MNIQPLYEFATRLEDVKNYPTTVRALVATDENGMDDMMHEWFASQFVHNQSVSIFAGLFQKEDYLPSSIWSVDKQQTLANGEQKLNAKPETTAYVKFFTNVVNAVYDPKSK